MNNWVETSKQNKIMPCSRLKESPNVEQDGRVEKDMFEQLFIRRSCLSRPFATGELSMSEDVVQKCSPYYLICATNQNLKRAECRSNTAEEILNRIFVKSEDLERRVTSLVDRMLLLCLLMTL